MRCLTSSSTAKPRLRLMPPGKSHPPTLLPQVCGSESSRRAPLSLRYDSPPSFPSSLCLAMIEKDARGDKAHHIRQNQPDPDSASPPPRAPPSVFSSLPRSRSRSFLHTQPIDFVMLQGSNGEVVPAGTSTFTITASSNDGPLGVEPGAELVVRVLWGQDSALSEGVFKWPK